MARPPAGPLANAPRDERDDFVGEPAEKIDAGPPLRWPPKPKRITKDTFHAKVEGKTSEFRADRTPTFRKGGWVSGYARGGATKRQEGGTVGVFGGESMGAKWKRENREAQEKQFQESKQRADEAAKRQQSSTRGDQAQRKRGGGVLSAADRKALPSKSFALQERVRGQRAKGLVPTRSPMLLTPGMRSRACRNTA